MSAGVYPLIIEQGATFRRVITWRDSAGALVNLTGYVARMHVRLNIADTGTLLSLTSAGDDIVLGGAAGTITITVSDTATAALNWTDPPGGYAVYDLEFEDGAGVTTRLLEGTVRLSKEVTR